MKTLFGLVLLASTVFAGRDPAPPGLQSGRDAAPRRPQSGVTDVAAPGNPQPSGRDAAPRRPSKPAETSAPSAADTSEPTLPPGADPRKVAQELVRDLRVSRPASNSVFTGTLKVRDSEGVTRSVPIECTVTVGEKSWQAGYQTFGSNGVPERAIVVHWPDKPNDYLYGRGADAADPKPLPRAQAVQPIGASDFWLIDLGLDFLHWPQQRVIKTEMRKSRWCNVIESIQPNPPPGSYARVVSWLDKETGGPILAEAYDHKNDRLKEFSIKSVKKVHGEWQLQEMEIANVKTRSRTRLEFDLKRDAEEKE